MTTRLLVDLPTARILFFTADESVELDPKDGAVVVYHEGPLPEGLTLANAWNYWYRDQKIIVPQTTKRPVQTLVERNRQEVLRFLSQKMLEVKRLFGPTDLYAEEARRVKLMQALAIKNGTAYNEEFVSAISASCGCSTPEEFAEFILKKEDQCIAHLMACEMLYRKWQYILNNCYDSNAIVQYSSDIEAEIGQLRVQVQA